MEGWIVLGIILIVAAYFFGRIGYSFNDEDQEQSGYTKMNEAVDAAIDAEDNKTRNLVIKTLKEIGCRSEENKETRRIRFIYQGEYFSIDAENESPFITIWDTYWARIFSLDWNIFNWAVDSLDAPESYPRRNILLVCCNVCALYAHCMETCTGNDWQIFGRDRTVLDTYEIN